MAHELATTNGRTAMAYFGEVPWHKLGTRLENPATAEEAIEAAGLNYEVGLCPLKTVYGEPVSGRRAVIREDFRQVLGVVGDAYAPIQNRECFNFLDSVVNDEGLLYHTAGALGRGERIWLLAKLPATIRVKNSDDITEQFLLLSNSHNGNSSLRVYFTPIRVVCANTLAVADRTSAGRGVAIRHAGDLSTKIRRAREVLGLARTFYDDLALKIDRLASYYPTVDQLQGYFRSLYPDPEVGNSRRAANTRERLEHLFEAGRGQDISEIRHSAWAAVNAVTEYVDHERPTRGRTPEQRADRRLQSQWFGSGARLKQQAWQLALQMLDRN